MTHRAKALHCCVNRIFTLGINAYDAQVDGLMQARRNSNANALELRLSCTNPVKWFLIFHPSLSLYIKDMHTEFPQLLVLENKKTVTSSLHNHEKRLIYIDQRNIELQVTCQVLATILKIEYYYGVHPNISFQFRLLIHYGIQLATNGVEIFYPYSRCL